MKLLTIEQSGSTQLYDESILFDKILIDSASININNGILKSNNNITTVVPPEASGSIFMYTGSAITQQEEYNILGGDLSGTIQDKQYVKSIKNVKTGVLSFSNGGLGKTSSFGIVVSGGLDLSDRKFYYNNLSSSGIYLTPCVENGKWVFKDLNQIKAKGYLFTGLGIRLTETILTSRNYFTVNKTTGLLPGDKIFISRITNTDSSISPFGDSDSWIVSALTADKIYVNGTIAADSYTEGFSITKEWTWYRKDNSSVADIIMVGGGGGGAVSWFNYPTTPVAVSAGPSGGTNGALLSISIPNPLLRSATIRIGCGGAGGFISATRMSSVNGRNGTNTYFITQHETLKATAGWAGYAAGSANLSSVSSWLATVAGSAGVQLNDYSYYKLYEPQILSRVNVGGSYNIDPSQTFIGNGLPGGGGGGGWASASQNSFSAGSRGIGVIIGNINFGGDTASKDSTLYDITHIVQLDGAYVYGEINGTYYSGTYISPLPKILATGGAGSAGSITTSGNKAGNGSFGAGGGGAGAINNNSNYTQKMLGGWGGDGYVLIKTY